MIDNNNFLIEISNKENDNYLVKENQEKKKDEKPLEDSFVTGLPDWDLTPPYEVVRRINR